MNWRKPFFWKLKDETLAFGGLFVAFDEVEQWLRSWDMQSLVESKLNIAIANLLDLGTRLQHLEVSEYDMIPNRNSIKLPSSTEVFIHYHLVVLRWATFGMIYRYLSRIVVIWNLRLVDISNHFTDSHICLHDRKGSAAARGILR